MTSSSPEYVSIPVPTHLVPDVYAFITQRLTGQPATDASSSGTDTAAEPVTDEAGYPTLEWTVDDLTRLAATRTPGIVNIATVMDTLATSPGTWMSTTDLERDTGIPRFNLRGSMSALTRHVKAHYSRDNWPFTFGWGTSIGMNDAQAYYRIDPATADRWTEIRDTH